MRRTQYLHFRLARVFGFINFGPVSKFGNFLTSHLQNTIKIDQSDKENIMDPRNNKFDYNYCFPEGVPLSFHNPTREEEMVELCHRKRKSHLFVIDTMFKKVDRERSTSTTTTTVSTYKCCYCSRAWTNLEEFPLERIPRLVQHARDYHAPQYQTRMDTKITTVSLSRGMLSDPKTYLVIKLCFIANPRSKTLSVSVQPVHAVQDQHDGPVLVPSSHPTAVPVLG